MIFSSISFLFLYLPVVFLLYMIIPSTKLKNIFLTVASLIFYAWGESVYVLLMLFSVFINWKFGLLIERKPEKKNKWLMYAIIINIGILFYFKYCGFLVEIINLLPFVSLDIPQITLPVGISFFTFQALSYVFDVKRGDAKAQKSYMDLLLYVSLFPQLIAGPIVKYHDVDQEIKKREINSEKISQGIRRFIIGLSKKVIIANNMALVADTIFAISPSELNIISAWIGAIAYLFQIYFDFSGYSDMAIGIGKMLGFNFKENFNYPLIATSIKDFWRRWHISLSTWFREYLYIPLGGNRKGVRRTYINQLIVFFATGLWHGANFTFIVWGLVHGLFLVLETRGTINLKNVKFKPLRHIYTLVVVIVLFVVFRADNISYALGYVQAMFFGFDMSVSNHIIAVQFLSPFFIAVGIGAVVCSMDILNKIKLKLNADGSIMNISKDTLEATSYIITIVLFAVCVLALASNAYNPFIYFRF